MPKKKKVKKKVISKKPKETVYKTRTMHPAIHFHITMFLLVNKRN